MDWYTRRILQSLAVLAVTVIGFVITLSISKALFPEHGCISLQGMFWALLYIIFFFLTAFRPFNNKLVNARIVVRNWLACIVLPTLLVNIWIYI